MVQLILYNDRTHTPNNVAVDAVIMLVQQEGGNLTNNHG